MDERERTVAIKQLLEQFANELNLAKANGMYLEWVVGPGPDGQICILKFEAYKRVQYGN